MTKLNVLTSYQKGVVARALLAKLIKQGRLEEPLADDRRFEILIPVSEQMLELLACFCEEDQAVIDDKPKRNDKSNQFSG